MIIEPTPKNNTYTIIVSNTATTAINTTYTNPNVIAEKKLCSVVVNHSASPTVSSYSYSKKSHKP